MDNINSYTGKNDVRKRVEGIKIKEKTGIEKQKAKWFE
jgi:hypothetical protein